jgi:hypothetical protein
MAIEIIIGELESMFVKTHLTNSYKILISPENRTFFWWPQSNHDLWGDQAHIDASQEGKRELERVGIVIRAILPYAKTIIWTGWGAYPNNLFTELKGYRKILLSESRPFMVFENQEKAQRELAAPQVNQFANPSWAEYVLSKWHTESLLKEVITRILENDFESLYVAYEGLQILVSGKKDQGVSFIKNEWANQEELDRFYYTANDQHRHIEQKNSQLVKRGLVEMKESEAQWLIRRLLAYYFDSRLKHVSPC